MKLSADKHIRDMCLVLGLTFLVLLPVLGNGFTNWDDPQFLLNNPDVVNFSFSNFWSLFSHHTLGRYHPLTTLTFAMEYKVFGFNAFVYHVNNLLLHLVNTTLVYVVFCRLLGAGRAFGIALLFGIHPLHVEPVAWITSRKDVLFGCFYFLTVYFYLNAQENIPEKKKSGLLSLACFAAALFSKAMAVTLPVALLALDYGVKRHISFRDILKKWPYFGLALVFGILTMLNAREAEAFSSAGMYSWPQRILFSGYALWLYMGKLMMPYPLLPFYGLPPVTVWMGLAASVVPALMVFILLLRPAYHTLKFGIVFMMATVWPVLHLFVVNDAIIYERFFYIPAIGFFIMIVDIYLRLLEKLRPSWRLLVKGTAVVYVACLCVISFQQAGVWKNSETLFVNMLRFKPQSSVAHAHLGVYYGDHNNYQAAVGHLQQALALAPHFRPARFALGKQYRNAGDFDSALAVFNDLLASQPDDTNLYTQRGITYLLMGRIDAAAADFTSAIALDKNAILAYLNRSECYRLQKKYDLALADLNTVLYIEPDHPIAVEKKNKLLNQLNR